MVTSKLNDKTIFNAARLLESPDDRQAYLQKTCGDEIEQRDRVAALLFMFDQDKPFLESPAISLPPIVDIARAFETPKQIGPYRIREQIGEGGMGVVYLAQQTDPVRRKVALKIIKPGMDSRRVIARFDAERQALAMMNHANIARIFDAGMTDEGRPYFAMELVRGLPIDEYCDEAALSLSDRLHLFIDVCKAIQHAHQKGIIHRDLKPSNVLVAVLDGVPVVKVIDFGLAKALEHDLTQQTLFTHATELIGTPVYMSPEQAGKSWLDIDTRSDVYSLGVLLYKLLSGVTPFDQDTLADANLDEMRRIIREDDPPRPSHRVSTLNNELGSTITERRGTDIRELSLSMQRELDWVVMKALEKDRSRRYQSASGLAADLQRYLDGDVVEACPPSARYRLRKFARRNKATLTTTSLVAIALLLGTVISISQAVKANEEAKNANAQTQRAEENLRLAMAAVDEMYTEVAESSLRTTPRSQESRKEILKKALSYYLAFAKTNSDTVLKYETAMAWRRVGEIYHRFEQNDKSQEALLESIELLQALVNQTPNEPRYRRDLASTYRFLSKPLEVTRQFEDGESYCRIAIEIQTQLVKEFPLELEHATALAVTYHQLGHMQQDSHEAIQAFNASRELFTDLKRAEPTNVFYTRQLAHDYTHLGSLLYDAGKIKEAEKTYRTSIELIGEASGPSDADVVDSHRAILGGVYRSLGILLRDTERPAEAATVHGNAVQLFDVLAKDYPTLNYYQSQLGLSQIEFGKSLLLVDRSSEAKETFAAAYRIFAKLEKDFPENSSYRQGREVSHDLINWKKLGEQPEASI